MTNPTAHPRGFASIMAIILIGLVAAALVPLGRTFVADARRTRSEADAAQLRQLLTAGAATAVAEVRAGEFPHHEMTLPQSLIDRGAALALESNEAEQAVIVQGLDNQFCPDAVQIADRNAYYRFLLLCVHCEFTIEAANLRYNVQGKLHTLSLPPQKELSILMPGNKSK